MIFYHIENFMEYIKALSKKILIAKNNVSNITKHIGIKKYDILKKYRVDHTFLIKKGMHDKSLEALFFSQ